MLGTHKLDG